MRLRQSIRYISVNNYCFRIFFSVLDVKIIVNYIIIYHYYVAVELLRFDYRSTVYNMETVVVKKESRIDYYLSAMTGAGERSLNLIGVFSSFYVFFYGFRR